MRVQCFHMIFIYIFDYRERDFITFVDEIYQNIYTHISIYKYSKLSNIILVYIWKPKTCTIYEYNTHHRVALSLRDSHIIL